MTLWGLLFDGMRRGKFIVLPFGAGECPAEILHKGEHAMHDNTENARRVFNKFCGALDKCGISYQKDDEELSVSCRFKGNDLVIPATIDF